MNNLGSPVGGVDRDDLALGEWVGVDFVAAVVLSAVGGVVKQRDDLFISSPFNKPGVVLETELDVGAKVEVGPETAQTPDDLAGGAIDLVDCTGVAGRDQIVAVGVFVDGVDMEVVPCIGRIVSRARLTGVERENSLCSSSVSVDVHNKK